MKVIPSHRVSIIFNLSNQFEKRCYVYNIFTTSHRWLAVIGLNLKLTLKLFFCKTITTNNKLPLKIYCKNIINISFLIWK